MRDALTLTLTLTLTPTLTLTLTRCATPPHAACEPAGTPPGVSVVSISLNAQQWSHNNLTFEYYTPPVVETFSPAAGVQTGGVLVQVTPNPNPT